MKWLVVLTALLISSCNHNDIVAPSVIPAGAPISQINDTIEFRVFGNIGTSTALIKYQDSINGLTILPAESLPYIARITSNQKSIFLYIEADATPNIIIPASTQAVMQVQIVINGSVFREAFASGFTTLSATASGTWNH